MDYVREHIKRYWGMAYRRTLGVALVTFAVALAMGLTFTALTGNLAINSYSDYLIFWVILILITGVIFLTNFYTAHMATVKYMSDEEHKDHSKYMGTWMVSLVIGVIAFLLPLVFSSSYLEPLVLLFTFGGVFFILFFSVRVIFKHSFGELLLGGGAFWFMFAFGLFELGNAGLNTISKNYFTLYFAAMSITVISGFVGLALVTNASQESMKDFTTTIEALETASERRRRISRTRKRGKSRK
jgi:hypothetical protein